VELAGNGGVHLISNASHVTGAHRTLVGTIGLTYRTGKRVCCPDREQIEKLLRKMAGVRIVVLATRCSTSISPASGAHSPEARSPSSRCTAGAMRCGAANVAANVAAIGAECRLVAVIGDDPRGDSVRAERQPVADSFSPWPPRGHTSKTRVVARGQQMLRIDEEVESRSGAHHGDRRR